MLFVQIGTKTRHREVGIMQNQMFRSLLHFFEGTGRVISTPSGDARGLVRVYHTRETVLRGRSF